MYNENVQHKQPSAYQRINITLPARTIRLLAGATKKRNRSSFIAQAVETYHGSAEKATLRKLLIEGYRANAQSSIEMAKEWFPLEEEAWKISQKER